jgi:hypothetical protein
VQGRPQSVVSRLNAEQAHASRAGVQLTTTPNTPTLALDVVDRLFDAVGLTQNPVAAGDWLGGWSSCLHILGEFDRAKKARD